jgi:hypothetical protein
VTTPREGELFHVCLVAANLEATMDVLSRNIGIRWTEPFAAEMPVRLEGGDAGTFTPRNAYSTTFPHVELVEARPGTLLTSDPSGGVHHVGYWVEDLAGGVAELVARGYRAEMVGSGPPAGARAGDRPVEGGEFRPQLFAYLIAPEGHRVELVDVEVRPRIEAWIRGESPV